MSKILCVISGGMDSATLLYKAIEEKENQVEAISFDYGQRHSKELLYASNLCDELDISHAVIDISSITPYIGGSALTDDIDVPEGHYSAPSMAVTVVPNRNAIMLSIAFGIAVARQSSAVAAAMHSGDHAIYPDCRPEFVDKFNAMQRTATEGYSDPGLYLWTPFIDKTKTDIAKEGLRLGIDYSMTWSCYKGEDLHCGQCGTCYERKEAFREAGILDPTEYA